MIFYNETPTPVGGTPNVMDSDLDSSALRPLSGGETAADDAEVAAWFGQSGTSNVFNQEELSMITETGRGNVIRQRYTPNGSGSNPTGAYINLDTTSDEMWLQYDMFFEPGFDLTTSGGKLHGLSSSYQGLSGGTTATNEWSARFTFRGGAKLAIYSYDYYDDRSAYGGYGRDFTLKNANNSDFTLSTGQWYTLRQRIKVNTTATAFNGIAQVWMDGVEKLNKTDVRWWGPSSPGKLDVGGFMYSSFFGGSSAPYNPSQTCYTRFDNFEIATDDALLTGGAY